MLLVLDGRLADHLARAVAEHLKWCRRAGVPAPAELATLLAALSAHSGQERPNVAPGDPQAVNGASAARLLGVSERTVRRMRADGRLPSVRVGRRVLVPLAGVRRLLDGQDAA